MTGSKALQMNELLDKLEGKINAEAIGDIIKKTYDIDLSRIPLLPGMIMEDQEPAAAKNNRTDALHLIWEQGGRPGNGPAIRGLINECFGVNLDAISTLDGKGISLFSKGQWIIRDHEDWIELHTGEGDRDVSIYATPRWRELHGDDGLPAALAEALIQLGYTPDPDRNRFNYSRTDGTAVPDAFKGATIAAIMNHLILQMPST
ncbi:hypothetical protein A7K91_07735 [Paenibacillus oryzae]|uniref:Uncharacterized protein n=1 Tax=Paenibacillus oryzae TaxID=1844972 RepID=A0A1A5YR48_9BACL|nr:hypothetical protein [Paenibacillus oryzae]OBR68097.1 hypothetical protein A7K91_07735 [Paenibacillus oryzae]